MRVLHAEINFSPKSRFELRQTNDPICLEVVDPDKAAASLAYIQGYVSQWIDLCHDLFI